MSNEQKSNNIMSDHFSKVGRMVEIGSKPQEILWILDYPDMFTI